MAANYKKFNIVSVSSGATYRKFNKISIPESIELEDTITLSDELEFMEIIKEDTITLSDEIEVNVPLEKIFLEDTVYLSEHVIGINKASYATRMEFYDGFLYISTDESPAQVVKVNAALPSSDYTAYTLNLIGENLHYAKDLKVNQTFDEIYIACADGKLAHITNLTDLDVGRETIEVETGSGANTMIVVDSIENSKTIYLGTDSSTAELYKLEESIVDKINTDLRTKRLFEKSINTELNFIKGKIIQTDFRFLATQRKLLKTDLRFYSPSDLGDDYNESQHGVPYNYLKPIKREDFSVEINATQVADVDLISIIVRHMADETSTAEFVLGRHYDKLNYMLDGTPSEITNNNPVKVYIKTTLIFEGNIKDLSADADNERVTVMAEASEWTRRIKNVDLSIASVDEQQNLYHALVRNVSNSKPDYDLGTTQFTGLSCKAGSNQLSGSGFTQDMEGEDIDIISGTYFVKGSYAITRFIDESNVELNRSPTEKSFGTYSFLMYIYDATGGSGYLSINPPVYRGIKVDLGDTEEERVMRSGSHESSFQLAEDIELGDWIPKQNWAYFWRTSGLDLLRKRDWTHQYLGTNLAPITGDIYSLDAVIYHKQRTYPNWIFPQGYYYVGTYPYKDVSVKNGKYIAKTKYEDREDGLYRVRSESYDFLAYARSVADLEYEKIVNINGDILPVTSASIDLTIDGFLYYNLKLLTRINIVNTIQTDIYKNSNGFPISVKTIEINSKDMLVHLSSDNAKSQYELQLIDGRYPDEPITYEAYAFRIAQKFDLPNWENTA